MLRPFLLIGIGGSGGKTLRIVRHELQRRLDEHGWTGRFPAGWRFLHIDVPAVADGDEIDLPPQLPQADYAGLVTAGVNYRSIDAALVGGAGRTQVSDLIAGWRPNPCRGDGARRAGRRAVPRPGPDAHAWPTSSWPSAGSTTRCATSAGARSAPSCRT